MQQRQEESCLLVLEWSNRDDHVINVNLSPLSFPQCTAQLQTFKLISFYPINCHHPLLVADVRKQSGPLLAARYNGVFPGATL